MQDLTLRIAIVGMGGISNFILNHFIDNPMFDFRYAIVRSLEKKYSHPELRKTIEVLEDENVDIVLECAGHEAIRKYGPYFLNKGVDVISISPGALWDRDFEKSIYQSARNGCAQLTFPSGAIGAIDTLNAASIGNLNKVKYSCFKPLRAWPDRVTSGLNIIESKTLLFSGTCREAARKFPKNVNVCGLVALAGLGFDRTMTELWLDTSLVQNVHKVIASGEFGEMKFEVCGNAMHSNPATSLLAAQSVCYELERKFSIIVT